MSTSRSAIRLSLSILFVTGLLLTSATHGGQRDAFWPQFHGPNRDNVSRETGLLKEWPEKGPAPLWTAKGLGHGYSTVSIAGGMIYTAGNVEKDTVITALDLEGKVLWQVKNGPAWTKDRPGSRSTPTIDADRLYHQSPLGEFVCLQARTGQKIWGLNTLEKYQSKTNTWALAESLLIDGDRVISCPGGPQTCMIALDKKTGSVVWQAPTTDELAGYSSPILVEQQGLRIIVALTAKAIVGVNAENGELLWHVKHESYADENITMPIYRDGCIFVSTLQTGSVKWRLDVKDGKASLQELWRTQDLDCHHGGAILFDGRLYGNSTFRNRNLWVCLDWATGRSLSAEKGVGKGSLTYADGMLYTLSEDGLMGLARPTPTGLELVSSFKIPQGGEGPTWAHPVVCGGRLYLRHGEFLYAYAVR